MRGEIVILYDYVDAGLTLKLGCYETLKIARGLGLRVRNDVWAKAWREQKQLRTGQAA